MTLIIYHAMMGIINNVIPNATKNSISHDENSMYNPIILKTIEAVHHFENFCVFAVPHHAIK